MKLQSSEGTFFELTIMGYQFENSPDKDYDSNWLLIKIEAHDAQGGWSSIDPSLLTYEVEELAEWFKNLGEFERFETEVGVIEPNRFFKYRYKGKVREKINEQAEDVETKIGFIEPNLFFKHHRNAQGDFLQIYFEYESRPSWAAGVRNFLIQFPLTELNLFDAAHSLRHQLTRYPQRTSR